MSEQFSTVVELQIIASHRFDTGPAPHQVADVYLLGVGLQGYNTESIIKWMIMGNLFGECHDPFTVINM